MSFVNLSAVEAEEYTDTQSLGTNSEYIALKKEKKRLQCFLHQFQAEFITQHGRKVQYAQDRAPVQREYDEYKVGFIRLCEVYRFITIQRH